MADIFVSYAREVGDIRRLLGRGRPAPAAPAAVRPHTIDQPRPRRWPAITGALAAGAALAAVGTALFTREQSPRDAAAPAPAASEPRPMPIPTVPPTTPPARTDEVEAVISDPDGFTNLRSGPGGSFDVVARIVDGERFATRVSPGEWWPVTTRQGVTGYIHRSRVRVVR